MASTMVLGIVLPAWGKGTNGGKGTNVGISANRATVRAEVKMEGRRSLFCAECWSHG